MIWSWIWSHRRMRIMKLRRILITFIQRSSLSWNILIWNIRGYYWLWSPLRKRWKAWPKWVLRLHNNFANTLLSRCGWKSLRWELRLLFAVLIRTLKVWALSWRFSNIWKIITCFKWMPPYSSIPRSDISSDQLRHFLPKSSRIQFYRFLDGEASMYGASFIYLFLQELIVSKNIHEW